MHKNILFTVVTVSSIIALLAQSGITDSLMAFLLVGAIPGTSYSLSPGIMLLIIALTAWLLIFRVAAISIISFLRIDHLAKVHLQQKRQLPKRRFGQV